jgi:hypothetical protein
VRDGGLDLVAAMAAAERMGCDSAACPELVLAVNAGLWSGFQKRKDGQEATVERDHA